jgi:hypothetical protein
MQIPCVYIPGPAPAVSVANNNIYMYIIYMYYIYIHILYITFIDGHVW